MTAEETAQFLLNARLERRELTELPVAVRPSELGEAYAAQNRLVELLGEHDGGEPGGFKVGCTNTAAMELLGADGPFLGRLLRPTMVESGATVSVPQAISLGVEPEYAYRVSDAMPWRAGGYDAESVLPYLEAVMPSIEIVGSRYADVSSVGVLSIIADNALGAGWVAGPATAVTDVADFTDSEVEIYVDEVLLATGTARNVLGHPLNVVAWLANQLAEQGLSLAAGDIVTTGTCTPLIPVEPGARVRCEFGALGSVSVQLAG